MGKTLRSFTILMVLAPLTAMIAEPFFAAVFDLLGLDTENWASPVLTWLADVFASQTFRYCALLAIGFGLGVWAHWLISKIERKQAQHPDDPTDFAKQVALGERMVDLSERLLRWSNSFKNEMSLKMQEHARLCENDGTLERHWVLDREEWFKKDREMNERFGGEVDLLVFEIKKIGLDLPFPLPHSGASQAGSLGNNLRFIGNLLKNGQLEDAQKLDKNDMWHMNIRND